MNRKNLYVEQRPQGDFAVRKAGSGRASAIAPTQASHRASPRNQPWCSAGCLAREAYKSREA